MNDSLRNSINELAYDVLKVYNINTPIVDIEEVVNKIGGRLVQKNELSFLTDGTVKKENDSFVITIPTSQGHKPRYNFTVAHELGHLFLGPYRSMSPSIYAPR